MSINHTPRSQKIEQLIEDLPKQKLPDKDLWQGIEFAILDSNNASESREPKESSYYSKKRSLFAIAASVVFVTFFGLLSYYTGHKLSGQELVEELAQQHSEHKQMLLLAVEGRPVLANNWQKQLAELDEAAMAVKKALEHEPNNIQLLKMLKKIHQQQIDLIEHVHAPAWQTI